MVRTTAEQAKVRALFEELERSPRQRFPVQGRQVDAPTERGVYVIRNPRGRVVYVGGTPFAPEGLRQRLRNHLGQNTPLWTYLKRNRANLRRGYAFQCIVVGSMRLRVLLEAYATGYLCPAYAPIR